MEKGNNYKKYSLKTVKRNIKSRWRKKRKREGGEGKGTRVYRRRGFAWRRSRQGDARSDRPNSSL